MISAVVIAVLSLVLVTVVAWPVLGRAGDAGAPEGTAVREADARVADALAEIDEIEFDRASGHLSDEDFQALAGDAKRQAVELIRRRDAARAEPHSGD